MLVEHRSPQPHLTACSPAAEDLTRLPAAGYGLHALFLVLFSYAFFFEGYTGLTVTLGAITTLFVLMQMTARVDWGRVFSGASDPADAPDAAVRS